MFISHMMREKMPAYWTPDRIEKPAWETVADAIERLDGKNLTSIVLEAPNGDNLAVAGNGTLFFVFGGFQDGRFFNALNPDGDSKSAVELLIGGQEAEHSLEELVTKHTALKIAKTFHSDGTLDDSVKWAE